MDTRIRELNGFFIPEYKTNSAFFFWEDDEWSSNWPSMFLLGRWEGPYVHYEFKTHNEAKKFINKHNDRYI